LESEATCIRFELDVGQASSLANKHPRTLAAWVPSQASSVTSDSPAGASRVLG
jgi:hypothetical protein